MAAFQDFKFCATLENFIGLGSPLEVEISVSNLPLYNLFVGEKKSCHFGMNFSFKCCGTKKSTRSKDEYYSNVKCKSQFFQKAGPSCSLSFSDLVLVGIWKLQASSFQGINTL